MITLHTLKKKPGSTHRRKVVGRGLGSGHGTYSTRGGKGQTARTGHSKMPVGFEGGRQPLIRQLPKNRGFKAVHAKATPVSLARLDVFADGAIVSLDSLKAKGLVAARARSAKILQGQTHRKLTVRLPASASAKEAIIKAGGSVA